jgi:hypothetical protein
VAVSMKRHYWADLLRTPANEDNNIIGLWKKYDNVGCYVQRISGMVFLESNNAGLTVEETSSRSTRRCEISGSHSSEYEDGCLLGCCTVWSDRSLLMFQRCLQPLKHR